MELRSHLEGLGIHANGIASENDGAVACILELLRLKDRALATGSQQDKEPSAAEVLHAGEPCLPSAIVLRLRRVGLILQDELEVDRLWVSVLRYPAGRVEVIASGEVIPRDKLHEAVDVLC